MNPRQIRWLGVIGFAAFCFLSVRLNTKRIEEDLLSRSTRVLHKENIRVDSLSPEEGTFLVSIDTEHDRDQVQAFYERELNEDPWQVDNVDEVEVPGEEDEIVVIEFTRVGDDGEWGTVAIAIVRENGQHATIGISLNVPQ